MTLEVPLTLQPMEAVPVSDLPKGSEWLFEPNYDGFRCVLFREGDSVNLQSRRQRPLGRFFREIILSRSSENAGFVHQLDVWQAPGDIHWRNIAPWEAWCGATS